jgi:hypothetical protein
MLIFSFISSHPTADLALEFWALLYAISGKAILYSFMFIILPEMFPYMPDSIMFFICLSILAAVL